MIELNQIKIIYPPEAEMETLANQLARMIKHYRIPGSVRKRTGINSCQQIGDPWLIVLCTPDTPKNPDILAKIDAYIEQGLFSHVLTLLAEGDPEKSFPDVLLHERLPDGTIVDHEPLAANVAGFSGMQRSRRLKVERLRLLAPMLGVSFDDLMNRRFRQRMRILTALGTAVLVLGLAFVWLLIGRIRTFREQNAQLQPYYERMSELARDAQDAADEAGRSYGAAAAEVAKDTLSSGDCELAMLIALEVLAEVEDSPEAADVLKNALKMRTAEGLAPVTATADASKTGEKPDREEAEKLISDLPYEYGTQWRAELSSEGYLLGVRGESEVFVYDPSSGQILSECETFSYPVETEDVAFAGAEDRDTGRRSADLIRCGNILFEFRTQETTVPESLDEQINLAKELLGGRTLSEKERSDFGIGTVLNENSGR